MDNLRIMIESYKIRIQPYYALIVNFGYLSLLQVFNLLLPLLTYPYLIRVLGAETYGMVIYSQAIVSYLVVLVNFGFNITATREISINLKNSEKINEIVSNVYIIKGFLFLVSIIFLQIFLSLTNQPIGYRILFYLTLWMCLYEFLFPLWYFQGSEKMKYITILTLVSRVSFMLLIFLLIKRNDDYVLVPLINGFGSLVACLLSIWILRREGIQIKWQPYSTLVHYLKGTYIMALSYGTNIFKTNFNLIIVKHLFSYSEVAYFDLALKITNLGITFLDLISQAVFPRMSRSQDSKLLKKIIAGSLGCSIAMMLAIQIFTPQVVDLLGGSDMDTAVTLTRFMALNLPIYIVGALLGRNCLLVNGYDRHILSSMVYSGLVYLILITAYSVLYPKPQLMVFVYVYLISFLFETIYRYRVCLAKKLI